MLKLLSFSWTLKRIGGFTQKRKGIEKNWREPGRELTMKNETYMFPRDMGKGGGRDSEGGGGGGSGEGSKLLLELTLGSAFLGYYLHRLVQSHYEKKKKKKEGDVEDQAAFWN